jgi:hypothetical protein
VSAVLTLALLAGVSPVGAQGTTSRVTGVVSDSSGGRIPGATVTLTSEGTGVAFTTITSDAGAYTFEAVQVGAYTVKVELQGFKTFESTGNVVRIGEPKTVNAVLETGTLAETVQVVGGQETVQLSTSGNFGSVIDQKAVETLPIVGTRGRNPLSLVLTQPGVVSGANTGGGTHVNGARDRSWNYTLDGIDINETSAGGSNFASLRTNPDSLAEFKVLTGNTTAEFGRNSGGQVAMVSRSGTNRFAGTGFYFGQRPDLHANEWERNIDNLPKRQFEQNIYGFSLGGPIKKSKAFFFTNLQYLRAEQSATVTRTVYTEAARNGQWRYVVGGRNQPFGVTGASVDANGGVVPGVNIGTYNIPANDPAGIGINSEIRRTIGLTPLPNNYSVGDGLNFAGYTFSPLEFEKQYDFTTKVDYVFNPKHYTFVRFSKGEQNTICDQAANGGAPPFEGLPCLVDTFRDPWNFAASWRWNPTSNLVNEFVVGRNHFTFDFVTPTADASRLELSTAGFTAGTAPTLPESFAVGNLRTINTLQIVNNTSYIRGAHSFKAGTNIRLQQHEDIRGSVSGSNVTPIVNFSRATTVVDATAFNLPANIQQANDRVNLESNINFFLGRVGSISQGFVSTGSAYAPGGTPFVIDARYPEFDFYVQDNWKPRSNLTIDLGLRWELKMSPGNPQDLLRRPNQRVAIDEAPSITLNWVEGNLYDDDVNNFAPSAGFAWDPSGDGRQVVRANYRMAYDRINTFVISSAVLQSIPGITTGVTNSTYGPAGGRLTNVPSLQPSFTPLDALQPAVSAGTMRVMDTEFQSPLTHAWALSYQREVFRGNVLEVAYIGRDAQNLFGAYDVNQAKIHDNGFLEAFNAVRAGGESALMNQLLGPDTRRLATETGSQFARRQFPTELQQNAVGTMAASIGTRLQGGRTLAELSGLGSYFFYPYPQFLGGLTVIDSEDYSRYHALQLKLERRFRGGAGYLLSYTLAKSRDTRSFDPAFTTAATGNGQSASSTPFDIYNRDLNYAPSDFDRRHVVQGSFVAELPFGPGKWIGGDSSGFVGRMLGGWELAGVMTVQSGRPFTVYGGAGTLSNVVQSPADCSSCDGSEGTVHDEGGLVWYFTPEERANFSIAGAGAIGNTGRNGFVGPGGFNLDLSLVKRTRTVGSQALELRFDATNLTNTPTFGFPTAVTNSATFGRIRNTVISFSRKVQFGIKYSF